MLTSFQKKQTRSGGWKSSAQSRPLKDKSKRQKGWWKRCQRVQHCVNRSPWVPTAGHISSSGNVNKRLLYTKQPWKILMLIWKPCVSKWESQITYMIFHLLMRFPVIDDFPHNERKTWQQRIAWSSVFTQFFKYCGRDGRYTQSPSKIRQYRKYFHTVIGRDEREGVPLLRKT